LNKQKISGGAKKLLISADHFHRLQQEFLAAASKEDGDSVHFDAFKSVLLNCGLPHFGTEEVFKLFDTDKSGTVDYCEFLLLLSSFREDNAERGRLSHLRPFLCPLTLVLARSRSY